MLYHSHGIATTFTGDYNDYFGLDVDSEAISYLMVANYLLHEFYPNIITIAEVYPSFQLKKIMIKKQSKRFLKNNRTYLECLLYVGPFARAAWGSITV